MLSSFLYVIFCLVVLSVVEKGVVEGFDYNCGSTSSFQFCQFLLHIFSGLLRIIIFPQYEQWKWTRSVMSDSFRPHGLVAYQAPPSMGFSRQECWSGLPFPSPGDLPDAGIKPRSPALQADALPSEPHHVASVSVPGNSMCFNVYFIWY